LQTSIIYISLIQKTDLDRNETEITLNVGSAIYHIYVLSFDGFVKAPYNIQDILFYDGYIFQQLMNDSSLIQNYTIPIIKFLANGS
jgi:hypothetical protein